MGSKQPSGLGAITHLVEELRKAGYLIVFKVAPDDWPFMGMDGTKVDQKCLVELYPFGAKVARGQRYAIRATGLGDTLVEAFLSAYKQVKDF